MRTNIDIDEGLMEQALKAGPYKTKKDAVEAGLKLLARQAAYREILKWRGKLKWEGDESIDWTQPEREPQVAESGAGHRAKAPARKRRAGR
ncbi:MAG: type II toxin-antitoxin system VapB family antitoxin [Rubrivivax sp.]|nr:type II toxin-antitoxin system VapB family antitoxin [Rubrivivax sp.]